LVQRLDIGTENVVLGGGRKEVLDVGVLTVLRGGLGEVVIKPQRCRLVSFGPAFGTDGARECMPVGLAWRCPGARVGDHEIALAPPRGRAERNPSALTMPEEAHRSGVIQPVP